MERYIVWMIFEQMMEEGLMKGKLEGKQEEQYQIASNLKKSGVDLHTIVDCTGLSMEEVEKL